MFVSAESGSGLGTATFNVNTVDASRGKTGFAIALMNKQFASGLTELAKLNFRSGSSGAASTVVSLSDRPVPLGVSDANALGLPAEYISGTITINPAPVLTISVTDQALTLAWPQWATNYALQEAWVLTAGQDYWTNVLAEPIHSGSEMKLTLPKVEQGVRFYRLKK